MDIIFHRVCCVCRIVITEGNKAHVTHTYCDKCLAVELEKLDHLPKPVRA